MNEVVTRRPMYRWKSFWLGVCVVAFLGWAWERSNRLVDSCFVTWRTSHGYDEGAVMRQTWGRIVVSSDPLPRGDPGLVYLVGKNRESRKPLVAVAFSRDPFSTELVVSHWFVMVVFLVSWGGGLVWKWRRSRCL